MFSHIQTFLTSGGHRTFEWHILDAHFKFLLNQQSIIIRGLISHHIHKLFLTTRGKSQWSVSFIFTKYSLALQRPLKNSVYHNMYVMFKSWITSYTWSLQSGFYFSVDNTLLEFILGDILYLAIRSSFFFFFLLTAGLVLFWKCTLNHHPFSPTKNTSIVLYLLK